MHKVKNPMHILHVITTLNRGGAENHLVELASSQVAQGHKLTVAYLKGDGYWAKQLTSQHIDVVPLGLEYYGDLTPLKRLRALLVKSAPHVVHAHMPPAELYTRLALMYLLQQPPMVVSKHNDENFYRGLGQSIIGHWVSQGAVRIIAISDAVKDYICTNLNIPTEKVRIIHYGINTARYELVSAEVRAGVRSQWGVPDDALLIGSVARMVPQKALHVLLQAYALYLESARQESRLALVGRGPLEADLRRLALDLGLSDKIIWAGFREDIPAVMNAFDCLALTSSYEGFGLVLLEAMAAKRAVVASRVSAIPEIVVHETTGLLCEPDNPVDFARALLRLEDTGLRLRMGLAGHHRASTRFTIDRMASSTFSVYEECLACCKSFTG